MDTNMILNSPKPRRSVAGHDEFPRLTFEEQQLLLVTTPRPFNVLLHRHLAAAASDQYPSDEDTSSEEEHEDADLEILVARPPNHFDRGMQTKAERSMIWPRELDRLEPKERDRRQRKVMDIANAVLEKAKFPKIGGGPQPWGIPKDDLIVLMAEDQTKKTSQDLFSLKIAPFQRDMDCASLNSGGNFM